MGQQVALASPEILILTHDDQDHIGGWSGFRSVGLPMLRELWVPYEWGVLIGVLADLDAESTGEQPATMEMTDLTEGAWGYEDERPRNNESDSIGHLAESAARRTRELLERSAVSERLGQLLKKLGAEDSESPDWRGTPGQVAKRAASRSLRLAEILRDASQAGARVRYFSVDHAVRQGVARPWERFRHPETVTIANAIEVRLSAPYRRSLSTLAFLLGLTIQNHRALCPVLWRHHSLDPAAIVWSDSSGDWTQNFPDFLHLMDRIAISTTPHHGSDNTAHDRAWRALTPFLARSESIMVLAGGEHTQKRVRQDFLDLSHSRRACTRCRHESPEPARSHAVTAQVLPRRAASVLVGGCRV
jgi:hypothetical protein